MITDLITSGAMHSLKSVFQKKKERNVIIDPFSCLVKLSLIRYLDEGTKISIYQNRLNFNAPSYIQGIVRFVYGDNREDLHNILLPIQKCVEWYWNDRNTDMIYMFNNAVLGLKFLKNSYSTYATIQHTLDYYIIILMQKNTAVMSRMGISTIDIERLTQTLLDSNSASASISISLQNESPIPNNNSNNNSNEKGKNKDTRDIARDTEKESRGKDSRDKKSESKEQKEHDALQHKQNEKQNEKQQDKLDIELHMQMRDIHKFLFELWNEREMGIVINLYREMETKQPGTERNYIYNNIMQYCEMKETKLYKYIEQNSSIL
jgi:hypothetical protein